ncbi:unnamed protein product [Brassica rapa]|uniref:Uncharacterized protein n=1 Tax=Brassica campestris TaxID=3711 RepID=A0A3P6CWE5_BRACM|nr:unnamed protein product [Brassica rapa]VDD23137.1 unnamed protein product [Brassica rapa]
MVRSLVTTTIASQIHPSSPGSSSQNKPDLKRELSRSYVGFSEVELCGKGGGGAKS